MNDTLNAFGQAAVFLMIVALPLLLPRLLGEPDDLDAMDPDERAQAEQDRSAL